MTSQRITVCHRGSALRVLVRRVAMAGCPAVNIIVPYMELFLYPEMLGCPVEIVRTRRSRYMVDNILALNVRYHIWIFAGSPELARAGRCSVGRPQFMLAAADSLPASACFACGTLCLLA